MKYSAIPTAQSLIQILKKKGIRDIVISPGSRNAPLTLGFNLDAYFKTYSIVDERCAAFFGLGLAQQTDKPVALVCTSGSALLNYYPAFAEAFYQQVPLIVISADRPLSKIDIGDGQTIRQQNVFKNHSLYNANLEEVDSDKNHIEILNAIHQSILNRGPVHINIPFEEPLYGLTDQQSSTIKIDEEEQIELLPEISELDVNIWKNATKKMVLVGDLKPNSISEEVIDFLANDPSIVVMTETTSNLHHDFFLNKIDVIITPFTNQDFEIFKPELLITIGGMLVSKRIKTFLRKYKPENHWHIDELRAYDTFGCLTKHFKSNPDVFFKEVLINKSNSSNYQTQFLEVKNHRLSAHRVFLSKAEFSDLKVFEILLNKIPASFNLQISNSSSIRYTQLFDLNPKLAVFCNRGTSGIDGSTSTAVGAAVGSQKSTLLITGDLSFLYDSNALWNNYIPNDFKIVVINNGGGGIFRILPGHEENSIFSNFFETTHQLTAEHLAKMYHFQYFAANDEKKLNQNLAYFIDAKAPSILEIFTPTMVNDQVLKSYFNSLSNIESLD